jgi:hypothetical protein
MSNYITAYEDDCYGVKITLEQGLPFFHVDVKRELVKEDVYNGKEIFREVKNSLASLGYERLYAYTPKIKFAKLIGPGFVHIENIPTDGEEFDLIVWELSKEN